jgi:hypothetical protein
LKLERYSKSRGKLATSNFFICDLANSALVRRPPNDAPSRTLKECKSVKKSLGALRKCVRSLALTQRSPAPPYAESVLTELLHNALVRGSAVSIIVTANPMSRDLQESMSAIRYGTYVAAQPNEEKDDSVRKPQARRRQIESRMQPSISELENQSESTIDPGDDYYQELSQYSPRTPGSLGQAKVGPAYDELEAAGELLRKIPEIRSHENGGTSSDSKSSVPRKELEHVSSLLGTAAKKMEADLTDAKRELTQSGYDQSLSAEEMGKQLQAVTRELETMKYDGHLAVQIQNDLLAAQEELKRLSVTISSEEKSARNLPSLNRRRSLDLHFIKSKAGETTTARSGGGAEPMEGHHHQTRANGAKRQSVVSTGSERLTLELAMMKQENEKLVREQAAKAQELAMARQQIQGKHVLSSQGHIFTHKTHHIFFHRTERCYRG